MRTIRLATERLELTPLPAAAAAALPEGRDEAARILGATLAAGWPLPDLVGVLHRQVGPSSDAERFGIWALIERDSGTVVGDVGFHGPPDEAGTVEIGYSIVPERRQRGYATEGARALVEWALSQATVQVVVAGCDRDNIPSIRTLERLGFTQAGEQGRELRWRYGVPTSGG